MSVLVSKRKDSKFEVITHSERIRKLMIELMQRGLGIKNVGKIARMNYICRKDEYENPEKYYYIIEKYKRKMDDISQNLTLNVRSANTIYPITQSEYELRRNYQTNAVVNCQQLICLIQQIVDIFDVDVNMYKKYIDALNREIKLIKNWRQNNSPNRAVSGSATNFANVNNNGNANYNNASNSHEVRTDSLNNKEGDAVLS